MSHIIGRGRTARETYPVGASVDAAASALRNRNVLAVPQLLVTPFSPAIGGSLIAAILFTPQVSGVVEVTAALALTNGGAAETYELQVAVETGTGLVVAGGAGSPPSGNGWIVGSTAPPTVTGATGPTPSQILGEDLRALAVGAAGSLIVASAISQPVPVGVPVVIEIVLSAAANHSLAAISVASLSILELP